MNKKEQIDSLAQQLREAQQTNIKLNETNMNLYQTLAQEQVNNSMNQTVAQVPFNDLDIYSQKLLNPEMIDINMSIGVKNSLAGIIGENNSGGDFLVYLLVLERARYFQSCVVFKGENSKLIKLLYKALYYGSMNGSIAIVNENNKYYIAYVNSRKYDKFGDLESCELQTFNYMNSKDFESQQITFKGERINNVVIFDFNNERFGLWVLCWFYLKHIYEFFETLINQQELMNKKFVFRGNLQNPKIRNQIVKGLTAKSVVVWLDKDVDLRQLESPQIDLGQTFNLIENYTNYFDFHILGIRTKDLSDSSKSRDIASQQLNHQTQADNKDQYIDYFIEEMLDSIRDKWYEDITFENRNIQLSDDIKEKSETINDLNSNGGENYD